MLSTKIGIQRVPREWVFEYYLGLNEKLIGQMVNVKSPFSIDSKPSLYIFYSRRFNHYGYQDFSTGKCGDSVNLVMSMFKLTSRYDAAEKILGDYKKYMKSGSAEDFSLREVKARDNYHVIDNICRRWSQLDVNYWKQFNINLKLLESYNVKPLESYTWIHETPEGNCSSSVLRGPNIYGYFRVDGTLYKIYQPYCKDAKFIKVDKYTQGTDQLTYTKPYLVILSSLKDIMGFMSLGYNNAEAVAPDSENSLLETYVMSSYDIKYKAKCTLFDIDTAGLNAMKKYEETFNTPYAQLNLSKDLTDSIRDYGATRVREELTPLLRKALNINQ